MDDLQRAEVRFRDAQERLKAFLEEHMEYTIDGLDFVDTRNRDRLDRELATLKEEHERAGAAWAEALGTMEATHATG
jgi:hypothetical protein